MKCVSCGWEIIRRCQNPDCSAGNPEARPRFAPPVHLRSSRGRAGKYRDADHATLDDWETQAPLVNYVDRVVGAKLTPEGRTRVLSVVALGMSQRRWPTDAEVAEKIPPTVVLRRQVMAAQAHRCKTCAEVFETERPGTAHAAWAQHERWRHGRKKVPDCHSGCAGLS